MRTPQEQQVFERYEQLALERNTNEPQIWVDSFTGDLFADFPQTGRLIDIGCGWGRFVPLLPDLGITQDQYFGVDFSPEQIRLARERNPGVQFETASIYEIGEKYPGAFSGFWCAAMLMLLPHSRLPDALRSVRGCLKEGALGLFSTPRKYGDYQKDEYVNPQGITISLYSEEEFAAFCHEAGLRPLCIINPSQHMMIGALQAV